MFFLSGINLLRNIIAKDITDKKTGEKQNENKLIIIHHYHLNYIKFFVNHNFEDYNYKINQLYYNVDIQLILMLLLLS